MFGDCLEKSCLIDPTDYHEIVRGTPLVACSPGGYIQFGIHTGENSVIIQRYVVQYGYISFSIEEVSFKRFCFKECSLFEYIPLYDYDKEETFDRACDEIGQTYNELRSVFGDDFVCISMIGREKFIHAFDNSKMGFHYSYDFSLNPFMRATHHAIAIENEFVIHFSRGEGKGLPQIICEKLSVIEERARKFKNRGLQKVQYNNETLENRLIARNRALLVYSKKIDFDTYKLLFNNCEHLATWCKTGNAKSKQVTEGIIDCAIIVFSLALKKPNPLMIKAIQRHFKI